MPITRLHCCSRKLPRVLKSLRVVANITQDDAAKMTGMSRPALSKIEHGRVPVTVEKLALLAGVYGFDVEIRFKRRL